ncbi:MAG: hypothetical protein NTX50_10170 [Candidatus Sumerlaeota bacterium]|nr:hypothetical protein [Candidatus Sumerlaeota bacterium]
MNSRKTNSHNKQVEKYVQRLNTLYSNVRKWMGGIDPEAKFSEGAIMLNEEMTGVFKAPTLVIRPKSGFEIRLWPRACVTIGSSGCLQEKSPLGRELLVYRERKKRAAKNRLPDISVPPRSCRHEKGWTWLLDDSPKNISNIGSKEFRKLYEVLTT